MWRPDVQANSIARGEIDWEREKKYLVQPQLEEAGTSLLCMKNWRGIPADLVDYWRHIQLSVIEANDLWGVAAHWPQPSRARENRMWEAWGWLRFLETEDAQLVLSRSFRAPGSSRPLVAWADLARIRRQRIKDVKANFDWAVERIAAALEPEVAAAA